jgi:hypothetical protein
MSDEQTFRSEGRARRALPLHERTSIIGDSSCNLKLTMVKREVEKRTLKLYSWVPSLLQVCSSLKRSTRANEAAHGLGINQWSREISGTY